MSEKNKINISPVISSEILKVISASTAIKTFGSQLVNKDKETLIVGNQTKTAQLDNELEVLTIKEQQAGETQKSVIQKAQKDYDTKQITEQQYNDIKATAEVVYKTEIAAINVQREKIQQDKNAIQNNPYTKLRQNQKSLKNKLKERRKKTQNEETKASRDLAKQVATNAAKTLAPIIALQLVKQFFNIINQRKKLELLVDQVNAYINTQIKDQQTVIIATNLRNNAITLIDNSAKKLENLKKTLDSLVKTLSIITAVIAVIQVVLSLPFPFLIPIKIQLQPRLQKLLILIAALNTILAIASTLLGNEVNAILELKERLKEISLKLDGKSLDNLTTLSNFFLPIGLDYPPYKNFTFKIKEEQDLRFVVKGNKRRYAVAINRDGVEQIKSEYSFTQDPNDLIEQLKLIIDQQNLQG